MTKEAMKHYLKRYHYLVEAIRQNKDVAEFEIGKRKERIEITRSVRILEQIFNEALENEKDELTATIIRKSIKVGMSDVSIYVFDEIPRSTYYRLKNKFLDKMFCRCISAGSVTAEELSED